MDIELIKLIIAAITSLILYFVGRDRGKKTAETAVSLNDHLILAIEKMSVGREPSDIVVADKTKREVQDVFAVTGVEKAAKMLRNRLEHWGIWKLKQQSCTSGKSQKKLNTEKIKSMEDSLTKQ